jgi:hypothetical protein
MSITGWVLLEVLWWGGLGSLNLVSDVGRVPVVNPF